MNKTAIRDAIVAQLRSELALQVGAAHLARDEAISEESRAENKYDTHSQEAAYLAEGQAKLATELEANLALYSGLALTSFAPTDAIALGAVVEVGAPGKSGKSTWYFLGPRGGGIEVQVEGKTILVLTPQSPLGRQLLGKRADASLATPGRAGASTVQTILSVQ